MPEPAPRPTGDATIGPTARAPAHETDPRTLLVATRSGGKLREIRKILADLPGVSLVSLAEAGIEPSPDEDAIEAFETFAENAVAKARHFRKLTGMPTIADDSGIVVDALGGAPGVRSRRFAPATESMSPDEQDEANNRFLVARLAGVPVGERTARYVCVAVLDDGGASPVIFEGAAAGVVLDAPRGSGGFGYDPYFFDPAIGRTFAELTAEEKDARSHRGAAFRALRAHLDRGVTPP